MKYFLVFLTLVLLLTCGCRSVEETNVYDLSGEWKFSTDPGDQGISEQWFQRSLKERITLARFHGFQRKGR